MDMAQCGCGVRPYLKIFKIKKEENKLKINFYKNFEPEDFLKIVNRSECLIGNTSSGIRECSLFRTSIY